MNLHYMWRNSAYPALASQFFPENFWISAFSCLAGIVFLISLSLWAADRFGDSRIWVVGGMLLGGIGGAAWHFVLMPVGATFGAVIGCTVSIIVARMGR